MTWFQVCWRRYTSRSWTYEVQRSNIYSIIIVGGTSVTLFQEAIQAARRRSRQFRADYMGHTNLCEIKWPCPLQWRHNERDGISNHQPSYCLLNRLFSRRSKKTPKPRVTGLCVGNSPVTGEFPAQRASNGDFFPFDDVIMHRCIRLGSLLRYRFQL